MRGYTLNITCNSIPGALEVEGSKTTIANNTIEYTLKVQGTFNVISANEIGSGYYWNGIQLDGSFNCVVGNVLSSMSTEDSNSNVIINNSFANLRMREYGEGGCNNNIISKNRVTGIGSSNDGIHLSYGGNNTISGNSIRDCDSGLTLTGAVTETSVSLNNFINNTVNIKYYGDYADWTLNNYFDNGTKGNYYDDYKGEDKDEDGVGDVPYTIRGRRWDSGAGGVVSAGFAQDRYPLMEPFDIDGFSVKLPEWASGVLSTFPEPETADLFPTTLVAASIITDAVVSIGLLVYFKKRKL